jgi:hypothetical protein
MKKTVTHFLSGLALTLIASSTNAQGYEWAGRYGGDGEDVVVSIHTDNVGNTYSTGYYTNTCDFDITDGTQIINHGPDYEAYVLKTNSDGTFGWAKSVGGISGENGSSITTDAAGNVYVTGVFQETADFDPGEAEFLLTASGMLDIFVLKLDANGNFLWAKAFGGIDYESTTGIGVDTSGNVYLSGYFYFTADFDPTAAEYNMTPAGSGDGFVVKLNPTGDFVWAKQFGGVNFELAMAMKVTGNGKIYVTGNFSGTADFDPDPTVVFNLATPNNYDGVYLLQLNSDGLFVTATKIAETDFHMYGLGLDFDNAGAAYITGYFGGTAVFGTGSSATTYTSPLYFNGYVAKINIDGEMVWAKFLDADLGGQAYGVAVNSLGQSFVYGFYTGTLTIDSNTLVQPASDNAQENYLVKFDADGNTMATFGFGGSNFVDGCAIDIDQSDNIYLSAAFQNAVDINPAADQAQNVSAVEFRDNYIIKMNNSTLAAPDHGALGVVSAYPNPTRNWLNFTAMVPLTGVEYTVFDMTGKMVLSGLLSEQQKIDLTSLQPGIYMTKIGQNAFKIIKE